MVLLCSLVGMLGCAAEIGAGGGEVVASGPDAGADTQVPPAEGRYHPEDFALPQRHGVEMNLQRQDCRACHGQTLTGGVFEERVAPDCDSCHAQGWRTNCIYCHGGDGNATGAPPRELDPARASASFPAHTAHVTSGITASTGCVQCHVQPESVLSVQHAFDATPGRAENDFAGGVAPQTVRQVQACSNSWCHGDGQAPGNVLDSAAPMTCSGCHPADDTPKQWLSMSGAHVAHLINPTMDCTDCHAGTTANDPLRVSGAALHVNGRVDVRLSEDTITYDPATGKCSGVCHLFPHPNLPWNLLGAAPDLAADVALETL